MSDSSAYKGPNAGGVCMMLIKKFMEMNDNGSIHLIHKDIVNEPLFEIYTMEYEQHVYGRLRIGIIIFYYDREYKLLSVVHDIPGEDIDTRLEFPFNNSHVKLNLLDSFREWVTNAMIRPLDDRNERFEDWCYQDAQHRESLLKEAERMEYERQVARIRSRYAYQELEPSERKIFSQFEDLEPEDLEFFKRPIKKRGL